MQLCWSGAYRLHSCRRRCCRPSAISIQLRHAMHMYTACAASTSLAQPICHCTALHAHGRPWPAHNVEAVEQGVTGGCPPQQARHGACNERTAGGGERTCIVSSEDWQGKTSTSLGRHREQGIAAHRPLQATPVTAARCNCCSLLPAPPRPSLPTWREAVRGDVQGEPGGQQVHNKVEPPRLELLEGVAGAEGKQHLRLEREPGSTGPSRIGC